MIGTRVAVVVAALATSCATVHPAVHGSIAVDVPPGFDVAADNAQAELIHGLDDPTRNHNTVEQMLLVEQRLDGKRFSEISIKRLNPLKSAIKVDECLASAKKDAEHPLSGVKITKVSADAYASTGCVTTRGNDNYSWREYEFVAADTRWLVLCGPVERVGVDAACQTVLASVHLNTPATTTTTTATTTTTPAATPATTTPAATPATTTPAQ